MKSVQQKIPKIRFIQPVGFCLEANFLMLFFFNALYLVNGEKGSNQTQVADQLNWAQKSFEWFLLRPQRFAKQMEHSSAKASVPPASHSFVHSINHNSIFAFYFLLNAMFFTTSWLIVSNPFSCFSLTPFPPQGRPFHRPINSSHFPASHINVSTSLINYTLNYSFSFNR